MQFFQGLSFTQWRYFQCAGAARNPGSALGGSRWYPSGCGSRVALCSASQASPARTSSRPQLRFTWLDTTRGFGAMAWVRALFRLWGHQPRFLLGAARGTRKQYRGASRVNHLLARNSQLQYPSIRVSRPLILASQIGTGIAVWQRENRHVASRALDRGFFFPNSYIPYRYRAWRGTGTARLLRRVSTASAAAARGRASHQARRVYVRAVTSARLGQHLRATVRGWRCIGGARRRPGRPIRLTALRRLFSPLRRLGRHPRFQGRRFGRRPRLAQYRPAWRRALSQRYRRWLAPRLHAVQVLGVGPLGGPRFQARKAPQLRAGAPLPLTPAAQPTNVAAVLSPASQPI